MKKYKPGDKFVIELEEEFLPGIFSIKGLPKHLTRFHLDALVKVEERNLEPLGIRNRTIRTYKEA